MKKILNIFWSVAVIVFSVTIIGLTLSNAKFIFLISRYGEETSATVIDTKRSSWRSSRKHEVNILTVRYTDKYNKTYITNITSDKHVSSGDNITIIYSRLSPKIADTKGNSEYKLNFCLELYYSFIIIFVAIYYYQEFKSTPDYWKSKKRY